jgi:hypothetical protein
MQCGGPGKQGSTYGLIVIMMVFFFFFFFVVLEFELRALWLYHLSHFANPFSFFLFSFFFFFCTTGFDLRAYTSPFFGERFF